MGDERGGSKANATFSDRETDSLNPLRPSSNLGQQRALTNPRTPTNELRQPMTGIRGKTATVAGSTGTSRRRPPRRTHARATGLAQKTLRVSISEESPARGRPRSHVHRGAEPGRHPSWSTQKGQASEAEPRRWAQLRHGPAWTKSRTKEFGKSSATTSPRRPADTHETDVWCNILAATFLQRSLPRLEIAE